LTSFCPFLHLSSTTLQKSRTMSLVMSEPMKIECSAEPMKVQFPVAKTFIQYPALRNPSLEAFFQEREVTSCPASRMASIDEEEEDQAPCPQMASSKDIHALAKEIEYTVRNTFIDGGDWESLRRPSLEGFYQERELKSCPATRAQSFDDQSPMRKQVRSFDDAHSPMKIKQEQAKGCEAQEFQTTGLRSRSVSLEEWSWDVPRSPAMRSLSLEECLRNIEAKYQDLEPFDDISTKAHTPEDTSPVTPEDVSDNEGDTKPEDSKPCPISLTNGLGLWSVGSAQHFMGNCKPCAFLWKDENGCQSGANCVFCHMCPPGEKKRRKKEKLAVRKTYKIARQVQQQQQYRQPQAFQGPRQSQAFEVGQPPAFQGVAIGYYRIC